MSNNEQTRISSDLPATAETAPEGLPASPIPDMELLSELGRGGMGVVYRARQTYLDRIVALKLLLTQDGQREFNARFQREAKILASLHHPHIVACHQAGLTAANHPYLVMEFIDGPDLRRHIEAQGPLSWRDAVQITRDIASALSHAHDRGIIHRDVKPENILLAPRATGDAFPFVAKLVDLGLARPTGGDMSLTRQGTIMGTPATMAPEQFDNPDGVDFRADIYGLGCALHVALTGQPAFTGTTMAQLISAKVSLPPPNPNRQVVGLPEGVGRLVTWMLERDRDARPATYGDLIAACDRLLGGQRLGRRGNRSAWIAVLATIGACGIGTAIALRPRPAAPEPAPAPLVVATPANLGTLSWAAPTSLWGGDHTHRLDGWTLGTEAQWTSAETRQDAIAGFKGQVSRDLGPLPCRITAHLHLFKSTDLTTDQLGIGLGLSDGRRIILQVQQLNKILASLTIHEPGDGQPIAAKGPHPLANGADLPVILLVGDKELTATIGGYPFERLTLPATPTSLVLTVDGDAPGEISGLSLQRPTP